ncbi:MAG: YgiQ family radical SAM protein [candidate division Zixibacteria bacterium]|nr:YgiQ family radical SAM protein [candidate division Zixibacteria bacterium]
MYIPATKKELDKLGWLKPDVILITGDTYIDSPFIGIAIIGKTLIQAGFKVAIIAQPDGASGEDIGKFGEPNLFWGVTGGAIDSMVANYTATKKKRNDDDLTPGGVNNRRPDRAVIHYSNLIRRYFKNTKPIVLGGVEASLRRISHYDYWSNQIRKSILFDSKADYLIYGMGEESIVNLARRIKSNKQVNDLRGICYISRNKPDDFIELPSFNEVSGNKDSFIKMFDIFYHNNDPITAKGLVQKQDTRYLVQNPPNQNLTQAKLDKIYKLNFERDVHPVFKKQGKVKALETIKNSITTHRGCYGECNFCSIAVHQGGTVIWRSQKSIINEIKEIVGKTGFNGYISDIGGPTANMYGFECSKKMKSGACQDKRCLYPDVCSKMKINHNPQIQLLKKIRKIPGIKKIFVASGIRYDMVLDDAHYGDKYLKGLTEHHVSGQMKIAPEHIDDNILRLMGKPSNTSLIEFTELYYTLSKALGKNQFLTYYLIAAHPGCTTSDMKQLKSFTSRRLKANPEQVQIFIPLPSTYSALMYYTEKDPFTGSKIFVEKNIKRKEIQKLIVTEKQKFKRKSTKSNFKKYTK